MRRTASFLLAAVMLTVLLAACGNSNNNVASDVYPSGSAQSSAPAAETKTYTDYKGREVEVPVEPQRIVYIGSNPGDLLAIGVKPIGASLSVIASQVAYPDLLDGIEDVGYPYSAEKVLAMQPDLILFDDWDEAGIEPLSKIAPTVVVGLDGTFPTEERVTRIAELLGRGEAATQWFDAYEKKAKAAQEYLNLTGEETATSLLILGADLYVMGNKGLNATLYGKLGFKPAAGVQKLIDGDERFVDVSDEVLPDYIGSTIFALSDTTEETSARQTKLTDSQVWKTIPAVQEGRVYWLDSMYNFDDPITQDRLIDKIVNIMNQ
ncbi:ABC transporter substrate-binding protein [Cohnella fermenti]|uniref:Fe/B12 periplasmic-binding domain-containing protein n=1 Tax=Cohnella fermenti TaxID=2565925 RepID=A0A4S4C7J2_9BACL|nr:ABC transporter substrate-binding protein [Cohnella fermenti]THF83249.1 hypothetical protein E6C55_05175 [Cohnella fermenti]